MDYDVIYLDDDGRNARTRTQDHRTSSSSSGTRTITVPRTASGTRYSTGQGYTSDRRTTVVYHQPTSSSGVLGNLTSADLVDMGLQVVAAIRTLPSAPTAEGDVETDIANMVAYQASLAEFAQNDERIRTLGNLLGRLLQK